MYFATSASELIAADTSVVAQSAGTVGVKVISELFYGMWHTFPQYSEGCGLKTEEPDAEGLWQGLAAIQHYGDFVKEVVRATRECPWELRGTNLGDGLNGQDLRNGTQSVNSLWPLAGIIGDTFPVQLGPLRFDLCPPAVKGQMRQQGAGH